MAMMNLVAKPEKSDHLTRGIESMSMNVEKKEKKN